MRVKPFGLRTGFGRSLVVAAVVGSCSGCMVGKDFQPPQTLVRTEWNFQQHPLLQGAPADLSSWWLYFQDPVLEGLISQALAENLTLREAGQRIIAARARRGVVAGSLYPQTQTLDGSFSQNRVSSNVANFFEIPGIFSPDVTPSQWDLAFAASWELDFWGKYRRSIEEADARLEASVAQFEEAQVLLLAEVTKAYIDMRVAEKRTQIVQRNLEVQEKTLQIAIDKQRAELGSGLDVSQARVNVGRTAAILPQLEANRLQASYRLCGLLGRPPIDLANEFGMTGNVPLPEVQFCYGIPADLLRRRPDVRRVEMELAAQSARIGIAQTDFYPQIRLNGNIGYQAEDLGSLFNGGSGVGFIAPSFSWKLLNYGRIHFNVEAEKANYEALSNRYRAAVIDAAREVEEAQVAFIKGHERRDALKTAVDGAADAVDKVEQLYNAGIVDFGRVFILQAALLDEQDAFVQTEAAIAASLVELFKSLGGGWDYQSAIAYRTAPLPFESCTIDPSPLVVQPTFATDYSGAMMEYVPENGREVPFVTLGVPVTNTRVAAVTPTATAALLAPQGAPRLTRTSPGDGQGGASAPVYLYQR